jgi:hypothetical protein
MPLNPATASGAPTTKNRIAKKDADYVFYELTRSICPNCRKVIDAKILLRDNKVYMAKRCLDCGPFEALVYGDAQAYTSFSKFNKPGTIPLAYGTEIKDGCPRDCGLCPDHQQHACLGIIEVNSACNMNCPLCFADARPGFSLSMEEVEAMLDDFVLTEGNPEVIQFSRSQLTATTPYAVSGRRPRHTIHRSRSSCNSLTRGRANLHAPAPTLVIPSRRLPGAECGRPRQDPSALPSPRQSTYMQQESRQSHPHPFGIQCPRSCACGLPQ